MKRMIALAAALALGPAVSAAAPTPTVPGAELSSRAARAMVDGCLALAESKGWKMNVVVMDRSGGLIAFGRADGAMAGMREMAMAKGRTAATTGWASETFGVIAWGKEGNAPTALSVTPGLLGIPGGLPIVSARQHLGGIGVSGSLPADDVACAKAGLAAAGL